MEPEMPLRRAWPYVIHHSQPVQCMAVGEIPGPSDARCYGGAVVEAGYGKLDFHGSDGKHVSHVVADAVYGYIGHSGCLGFGGPVYLARKGPVALLIFYGYIVGPMQFCVKPSGSDAQYQHTGDKPTQYKQYGCC